eukprot:TRINITY_DN103063_c0_g1_i1.p1 TRINITY_DN103063_c0_g1~~TRINITY_DN103063_c0_g1_i1.p1  ORF type:complete len:702 (+),score=200.99 TRINITY_DN103063_c0_g1_i1:95-2200(+)
MPVPSSSPPSTHERRLSIAELRAECQRHGLSLAGCVERSDLEHLLAKAKPAASEPAAGGDRAAQSAPSGAVADIAAELESWVAYAPRALHLISRLETQIETISAGVLKQTKLGLTLRRYIKHDDGSVAEGARRLVEELKRRVLSKSRPAPAAAAADASEAPSTKPTPPSKVATRSGAKKTAPLTLPSRTAQRQRRLAADDDDSENEEHPGCEADTQQSSTTAESVVVESGDDDAEASDADAALNGELIAGGWRYKMLKQTHRKREERFRVFALEKPFRCSKWKLVVRIADATFQDECLELITKMSQDFGAATTVGEDAASEENERVVKRLARLEERFRGSGVTEGEARNAMRLFERELSRANWTADKFEKLKKQLAGTEEWSAADVVAETQVRWTGTCARRQAWFAEASERLATPLGLESGYMQNGGCCFVGPLSAAVGACLTMALVCHLADLDLARASGARGGSRISAPQFMQGFVDGALQQDRHLVWEKLFSIEDETEAARYCQENLQEGFFDNVRQDATAEPAAADNTTADDGEDDLRSMLEGLFAAARGNDRNTPSRSTRAGRQRRRAEEQDADMPQAASVPESYVPFAGQGKRLDDCDDEQPAAAPSRPEAAAPSWALVFASNLTLARSSRRRSREQAKKVYHWSFSGTAVKATPTNTASYSKGKQAGEKRKAEISNVSGAAKRKFQRGGKLALTR